MTCPFLKETRVKYCDKSAIRKMIRIGGSAGDESCSSPAYLRCPVFRRNPQETSERQCPHLRESLVRYCATSAVSRFIPYHEPPLSRCDSDAHRYCDVYLCAAQPQPSDGGRHEVVVSGIRIPTWLDYYPNHIWLDSDGGGFCHFGVDAFMARVLGAIQRITFLMQGGVQRASAVFTVQGTDLEVTLPNPIVLTASNVYLRANPDKLTADPYGTGWLFQGVQSPDQPDMAAGAIHGDAVLPWMEAEIGRMSAFLGDCWNARRGTRMMNDGGVFREGVLELLSREDTLRLFHEFFWSLRV